MSYDENQELKGILNFCWEEVNKKEIKSKKLVTNFYEKFDKACSDLKARQKELLQDEIE